MNRGRPLAFSRRGAAWAAVLALASTGACGSGHTASDDATAGAGSDLDAARLAGIAACSRYIECNVAVAPATVGPLLDAYGPDGTCWQTDNLQAIELCSSACEAAREQLFETFPDEEACGECSSGVPCSSAARPACDPDTYVCVECVGSSDCEDEGLPYCVERACVECRTDMDCGAAQICQSDHCEDLPVVCNAGEERCEGTRLEVCDPNGVAWELLEDCASSGLLCDAKALACAAEVVCSPGADFCAFDAEAGRADVRTCNADGTASTLKTACVSQGRTCYDGACVVTEYGPCMNGNSQCAKNGDECIPAAPDFNNYKFVCASQCPGACPAALPPGSEGYPGCYTTRCMLGCNDDAAENCPPGMVCWYGDLEGPYCMWST